MGRKDAQRTKGNTKAASSARSAQQLGDNVGFVGFGTSTESGFVPLLQGADVDDGVPGDFRLALRKMHKKDVTTKVKALQEFIELALLDHDGNPEKLDGYHIVVIRGMEENRGVGEDRRGPTIEV